MIKSEILPTRVLCVLLFASISNLIQGAFAQGFELSAPIPLSAPDGDYPNKVSVTWDAVREAAQYRVYRSQTDNFETSELIAIARKGVCFDIDPQFEGVVSSFFY